MSSLIATRAGTSLDEVARRNVVAYVGETMKPSLASLVRRSSNTVASTGSSSLKVVLACVLKFFQRRVEQHHRRDGEAEEGKRCKGKEDVRFRRGTLLLKGW
jgi:hypothetical protein